MFEFDLAYFFYLCKLIHVPSPNPVRHITDSPDNISVFLSLGLYRERSGCPVMMSFVLDSFFFFPHFFSKNFSFYFLSLKISTSVNMPLTERGPERSSVCPLKSSRVLKPRTIHTTRTGLTFHLSKSLLTSNVIYLCHVTKFCRGDEIYDAVFWNECDFFEFIVSVTNAH